MASTDRPWTGDTCSLVDAFRRGERHPTEELALVLAAIETSELNPVCHLDPDAAETAARDADVSRPFGGVPIGVKELEAVAGWPYSKASVPLADRRADRTSTQVARLVADGGAVLAAQTTSSEFGGVNLTRSLLHGVTRNPWDPQRTPGGSSGGSAAAVAGGLLPIATGTDGGGSIRIPAGFCGLVGLKSTYGRIPLGPGHELGNLTTVTGCMARSVRDTARWFDVVNGHHPAHPLSLPRVQGWEAGLGTLGDAIRSRRVAVVDDWGGAVVAASTLEVVHDLADWLASGLGWVPTEVDASLPRLGAAWSISGMVGIRAQLGDRYPDCADDLTPEIAYGLVHTAEHYGSEARARIEARRAALNDRMAEIFDSVDLVVTATNPDVAFAAEGPLPDTFGGVTAGTANNGLLTFPANLHGNPAISIPAGFVAGLPVGVQVIGRHFTEPLLLEIAHRVERERPWPLVTPI